MRAHVEDGQDVRVAEGGDGARFLFEAAQPLGVSPHLGRENLDRDLAPQPRIPCPVHLPHPPGPDEVEDLVRPQPRTGGKGQGEAPRNLPE